jgi:hypothetical protein
MTFSPQWMIPTILAGMIWPSFPAEWLHMCRVCYLSRLEVSMGDGEGGVVRLNIKYIRMCLMKTLLWRVRMN